MRRTPGAQGGVILSNLLGEGSGALTTVIAVVVVLVLLALAFWLVRRFGGGRLGGGTTSRTPAAARRDRPGDGRRPAPSRPHPPRQCGASPHHRRADRRGGGAEHSCARPRCSATWCRRARPPPIRCRVRCRSATTPCGRCSPSLLPRASLRSSPSRRSSPNPRSSRNLHSGASRHRVRASFRGDGEPRPPTTAEEPAPWPGEPETPRCPRHRPRPSSHSFARPAARERRPAALDPLAGLAEELSRLPSVAEPPRRGPGCRRPRPLRRRPPRGGGRCARRPESFRDGAAARSRPAPPAQAR